jgi:phosphoglycerate dehydrogenase-like enzyme
MDFKHSSSRKAPQAQALMNHPNAAFFGQEAQIQRVYAQGRREQVAMQTRLYADVIGATDFAKHIECLRELEVIFSTWGMPPLTCAQLEQLPNLKIVFYAAGSVQSFARPFLERGITVVSAWQANGVPVAEFTLAQILLSNKGYFANTRAFTAPENRRHAPTGPGNFGATLALLGAGAIGRKVIELLRPFRLQTLVSDPFLSEQGAAQLGVEKVELLEAFARANVVSNHLANLPATVKMLRQEHFAAMSVGATFINTGRGHTVDETGLIHVLQSRPDLTALLDVTHPEPPTHNSPLYQLPNVQLSSHIAGSIGDEVVRMADYVLEEFHRWRQRETLCYAVTLEMLETMA